MEAMMGILPLIAAAEGEGKQNELTFIGLFGYVAILILTLFALLQVAKTGFTQKIFKNPLTQCLEQVYLFVEKLCLGIIGRHGHKYIPIIMTFWLVIFTSNCIALFFPSAPTADMSFNLGMALIAIGYVQYEGIRTHGLWGHLGHFSGPKLGGPLILVSGMIFVIEIISEVMKNLSLSLRLYGNIEGGQQASDAMNKLGADYYIPFGAFLLPIKMLTVIVQSLIFSLLTCVYLALVTQSHEDHSEEDTPIHAHG